MQMVLLVEVYTFSEGIPGIPPDNGVQVLGYKPFGYPWLENFRVPLTINRPGTSGGEVSAYPWL